MKGSNYIQRIDALVEGGTAASVGDRTEVFPITIVLFFSAAWELDIAAHHPCAIYSMFTSGQGGKSLTESAWTWLKAV